MVDTLALDVSRARESKNVFLFPFSFFRFLIKYLLDIDKNLSVAFCDCDIPYQFSFVTAFSPLFVVLEHTVRNTAHA